MRHFGDRPGARGHARRASLALLGIWALAGCGGPGPVARPTTPWGAQSFHHVFLRGGPAPDGAKPRIALTVHGPDPCGLQTLERLASPGEGLAPLPVTFFWSPERVRALRDTPMAVTGEAEGPTMMGQAALPRMMQAVVAGGHGLGLLAEPVYARWAKAPAALEEGLRDGAEILAALAPEGRSPELVGWRPPPSAVSPGLLQSAGEVGRPVALWSLHLDESDPQALAHAIKTRAGDGDIIALDPRAPTRDGQCVLAEAVPAIVEALSEAGLEAVTLDAMLGTALTRFEPLRLARYQGEGLTLECAESLDLPLEAGGELDTPRWGVVDRQWSSGALQLLPLPGAGGERTAEILDGGRALAEDLWRRRRRWRALPACLKTVPEARVLSPITAAPGGRARWWWSGAEGVVRRQPRMLTGPSRALVLPARSDLLRVEALSGISRRLRGVVPEALAHIGLDSPMLIEGRTAVAVVVGGGGGEPTVAGYVPVVEFEMGEYRFLAALSPGEAEGLTRASRGAEGFYRAGPWITLPRGPGAWPRAHGVRLNALPSFPEPPEALVGRLVALGLGPEPGDVVIPHPGPDVYAELTHDVPASARPPRHVMRKKLQQLLKLAFHHGRYLRPGHVMQVDAASLGAQAVRVALAPGVAPLLGGVNPLVDLRAPAGGERQDPDGAGAGAASGEAPEAP